MADETNAGGTQAEPNQQAQPQAGSSSNTTAATTASGTQAEPNGHPGSESMSLDEAKKLRSENQNLRKRNAEYERAQQEAEAAKLSDLEKASKRADTAEATLAGMRQRIGASELKMAAQAAGIIDADVASAMLGSKVEYDAAGEPTNVADLVTALKKDKPHLFSGGQPQRPPATSGGATNPGRQAGNGGLTLEMIKAMTNKERVARINEIRAWEQAQQQR